MKYRMTHSALIILCITALFAVGMISDAAVAVAKAMSQAELAKKDAEIDALANQLDSAVAELHAAGALLEEHGLKLHDEPAPIER